MIIYHVVEFIENCGEKSVAVIPDPWLFKNNGNDSCYWPDNGQTSWVQKGREPDRSWPIYRVRILQSTSDFSRALKFEKRAMDHSDVNSGTSDGCQSRKRKKVPRQTWSPEHSQETQQLEAHVDDESSSDSSDSVSWRSQPRPSNSHTPIPNTTLQQTYQLSRPSPRLNHTSPSQYRLPPPSQYRLPPPPTSLQTPKASRSPAVQHGFPFEQSLERLFKVMEELKLEVRENTKKLNRLLQAQDEERESGRCNRSIAELPDQFIFPLESPEDLERLELLLQREEETRNRMVRHLGMIGGRDQKDNVRRVMAAIFSSILARGYNYLGMKGKKSLIALRTLIKTVHESVRKQHPMATESQMREAIAGWIAGSRDRDHGRKEREEKRRSKEVEQQ